MTDQPDPSSPGHSTNLPQDEHLAGARHQPETARSALLEAVSRVLYPAILVVATYLLLVGLSAPGGGFVAGLTVGLGLLLRRIAGGPHELGAAVPAPPGVLLGLGLVVSAGYGVAGLLLSGHLLHGTVGHIDVPGLPALELPASLVFEIGVALIVVGLVLDVLRTLGEEAPAS